MSISQAAYRYWRLIFVIVGLGMAFGVFSYFTLPAREDPEIVIREARVTATYPGLSAERMELLVTKPLEEAVRQVPELEEVTSVTRAGSTIVHAVIQDRYFQLDAIWTDLREKVSAAEAELPEGTNGPFVDDDFGDVAVVTAALSAPDFPITEVRDMAQHVRDRLYGVAGTKRVDLHGAQPDRIYIEVSNARLGELGLSPDAVVAAIRAQNTIRPGGTIDTGERSFIVEPTGTFTTVQDVRDMLIAVPGNGGPIPLGDLATVTRQPVDPPERTAHFNGDPAIVLAVAMLDGYRVLDYADRLAAEIEEIRATLPVGYTLEFVTFQADQVEKSVYGVTFSVLQTLVIVLLVVIVFLGLRTGLIVGAIVPAVMLITLAVMGAFNLPLERMSLATLVIALGLLVDNGIVVAEDFKRRLELGQTPDHALKEVGRTLALPLLSSTATTILFFLPLMLADHQAGEYTRSISLVVLIALVTSWLLAMTVTPSLARRFLRAPASTNGAGGDADQPSGPKAVSALFGKLEEGYLAILRPVLGYPFFFLAVMVAGLAGGGYLVSQVPNKFFPASDRAQVLITLDLPADATMRVTDARLREVMADLGDGDRFSFIESVVGYGGYGGPRFVLSLTPIDPAPNKAFLVANLTSLEAMPTAIAEIRALLRESYPGLDGFVTDMFLGPTDPSLFHVQVRGPDAGVLIDTAEALVADLSARPGVRDVFHDWESPITRLVVAVDQAQARRAGVTSEAIARALNRYYSGEPISEFREGDEIYPIVVRAVGAERGSIDRLEAVTIPRADGQGTVPLVQVASIDLATEHAAIAREDLVRTVTVEARPTQVSPEDLAPQLADLFARYEAGLPPGHHIELDGVVTESAEGRAALAANLPLCLTVIVLMLIAQFNSLRRPAIILAVIPFLIIGAGIGLTVMGANFGFMVILGLLSLAGIIVNNAIVLVSRIDQQIAVDGEDAGIGSVMTAARERLRPIVLTTVTTILGLMPLIVTVDPLFYGLAVVVAFGLAVGTVLTLGIVPVLYSLLFRLDRPA